jgi:glucan phosphoethanolaminetransferase (alkaline phosphatase superfamily)
MIQSNFKSVLFEFSPRILILFLTNIAALLYHVVVRIFVILSTMIIGMNSSLPASEEERLSRMVFQDKKSWFILFSAIVAYFIFGLIIKNYKNNLYNFLSVSLVSILGLLLGIACFFEINFIGNFNVFQMYSFYVPFMQNQFHNNFSHYIVILANIAFILIPSLSMWLGNQVNRLYLRHLELKA